VSLKETVGAIRVFSHDDSLSLARAKHKSCTLFIGDANLRIAANKEQINVMDTVGLQGATIENHLLTVDDALEPPDRMKSGKRRMPRPEAEEVLNALSC
jgi:hypothetical protein